MFEEDTYKVLDREVLALETEVLVMKRKNTKQDDLYQKLDFQRI